MSEESSNRMYTGSSSKFFRGLMVGAIIGAAVALLYAPKAGSETRRIIKQKASAIKEKASKAVREINKSADSLRKS